MKNNINGMEKFIFFILISMVFGWASPGMSFEPWEGETINNVSLRETPGSDQKILTDLNQGVAVTIIDKNGEWCQVIAKGNQPRQKSKILRKLLFSHGSAEQSELKGWVLEKDIKRVSEKAEAPVAAPVKEEESKPEASGEKKANVNQEPQEIKALPPVDHEAKAPEPLANTEPENSQPPLTGKEEKKIESLSATPEKKVSTASPEPAEIITGAEKKISPPEKAVSTQDIMPVKKEKIMTEDPLRVKTNVKQEPQEIKALPPVDHEAKVPEPLANEKQEKAQSLVVKKEEKKVEKASDSERSKKTTPIPETREEKKIESLAVTEEKKIAGASPQSSGIVSGTQKNVFSEKPGEQKEEEQKQTSFAQDKQGLAGEAKGVMFWRDALRGIALLAIGIIACLAFIFSFRAYRISQACYQMMNRFQAGRENLQKKEEKKK